MAITAGQLLGRGVLRPLVRDEKNDFANADGVLNVRSCVGQILGTKVGELRWRPQFGSRLYLLLHRTKNPALADYAHYLVTEALSRWEPRARLGRVSVSGTESRALLLDVEFTVVGRDGSPIGPTSVKVPVG